MATNCERMRAVVGRIDGMMCIQTRLCGLIVKVFVVAVAIGLAVLIEQARGHAQQQQQQQPLLDYDKFASSSLFGEPVFRLEPAANVIRYSNTRGTTLLCLASGAPKPTISWFTSPSGYDVSDHQAPASLSGSGGGGGGPLDSTGLQPLEASAAGNLNSEEDPYNRPVGNITNLRLLLQDGNALRLLPFAESDFRRDVHAADYRCVASNQAAAIHSRSVSVQAVLRSQADLAAAIGAEQLDDWRAPTGQRAGVAAPIANETSGQRNVFAAAGQKQLMDLMRVNDEFVQLTAPAVLKCRIQLARPAEANRAPWAAELLAAEALERRLAIEWFTSDGFQVATSVSEISTSKPAPKFLALHTGELHVASVDMNDLRRTYGCRLRNATSRRLISSSNMAQLILVEGAGSAAGAPDQTLALIMAQQQQQQQRQPHVLHTVDQVVAYEAAPYDSPESYGGGGGGGGGAKTPPVLLLPCAVRLPAVEAAASLRWRYQAPGGARHALPLEQLAAGRAAKWLQLVDLRPLASGALSGVTSALAAPTNSNNNVSLSRQPAATTTASKLAIGPTYLALERPRAALSGRYLLQWSGGQEARNLCDITVIVRQPLKLRLKPVFKRRPDQVRAGPAEAGFFSSEAQALAAAADDEREPSSLAARLIQSLWPAAAAGRRRRRFANELASNDEDNDDEFATATTSAIEEEEAEEEAAQADDDDDDDEQLAPLLAEDATRIRVGGAGAVGQAPILRIGDRLELECAAWGHPIDSLRWFRRGQAINTQTSSDFQIEITTAFERPRFNKPPSGGFKSTSGASKQQQKRRRRRALARPPIAISRLLIRQLQARDAGLQVFECFGQNALGERARASQTLLVAERQLVEDTRNSCPLGAASFLSEGRNSSTAAASERGFRWLASEARDFNQDEEALARLFKRQNPFKTALALEGEPVELECPSKAGSGRPAAQVDWFKWWPAEQAGGQKADEESRGELAPGGAGGQFNQLFGGDSRFVINGSRLQIRSPSRRHDETLFVCLRRPAAAAAPAAAVGRSRRQAELTDGAAHSVHQSSLAGAACLDHLLGLQLKQGAAVAGALATAAAAAAAAPLVSSISIRIVARPKIDPFEFSRNLEEGMRTMVVCTVVSGQSPVDIDWFKDGELLISGGGGESENQDSDEAAALISVSRANEFSSTLTIRKIRPEHSGHYTCIAASALAAAEHTSRLLINVAPYFVEPPRSQRVYLNANALINCRAGGQPAPQIRWRKLVPVGGGGGGGGSQAGGGAGGAGGATTRPLAPSLGGKAAQQQQQFGGEAALQTPFADYEALLSSGSQQMAPAAASQQPRDVKQEFRIITSNSHIQVLENGSMIIKEVDLADEARYSCQASNGIQPLLSETIELQVLQPAQFEVNYETISVRRDATVKLSCAPRGDQPLQIDWFKEGARLLEAVGVGVGAAASSGDPRLSSQLPSPPPVKYSETLVYLTGRPAGAGRANASALSPMSKRRPLVLASSSRPAAAAAESSPAADGREPVDSLLQQQQQQQAGEPVARARQATGGAVSSELLISATDRSDTGLFVCVARNAFGKDELTYRLVVQEPPDAPHNLQLGAVAANSLKLAWQAPFDGNLPISHFVVEYKRALQAGQLSGGGGGGGAGEARADLAGASQPPEVGANLDWMRLVVAAAGGGQLQQQQLEQQLQLNQKSEPAKSVVTQLQRAPMRAGGQVQPGAREGPAQHGVVLKHLSAKTNYQIRVAAVNPIGQGLFSPIQLVATAEEAPQARASDLRAQPQSASAIKLSWRGPLATSPDEPAPIRGYHVSYRPSGDLQSTALSSSKSASAAGWLASLSLSATNFTSSAAAPASQPDSLASGGGDDDKLAARSRAPATATAATSALVSYELMLNNLERNARYELRVQPFNSQGLGPASEIFAQTLRFDRPGQPALKLVEARKQSLELKWSMPAAGGANAAEQAAELLGFTLYYKCEYDAWQELQLGLIYRYAIEGLRCGNKYQIYLSAFNSVGRSEPSDVLAVRTEGAAPLAPDKSQLFKLNSSEVVLDMGQWASGGCPISSFMIQFKRLHDTNWFILSEGATPFTQADRITIPDLTPATWYKLLVTAQNEAGNTNAEYIFSTLTPDGRQLEPPSYLVESNHQQQRHQNNAAGETRQPMKTFNLLLSSLSQMLAGGGAGAGGEAGGALATAHNSQQQQQQQVGSQLLLPLSCILLLLVTSLASYLYCNRAPKRAQPAPPHAAKCRHQAAGAGGGLVANCPTIGRANANQLQLLDRHLLHAHCTGSAACDTSSSSSSSGASMQQQQQRSMAAAAATANERQLIQTSGLLMTSKSQLLPLDAAGGGACASRAVFEPFGLATSNSSPRSDAGDQQRHQQNQALLSGANYVLDSFLSQHDEQNASAAPAAAATQTSSFVCPSLGASATLHRPAQARQDGQLAHFRMATMKLVPRNQQHAATPGAYCFEGAATASSLSSSGLGSAQTTTSGQSRNLQLIDELQQQQQQQQHERRASASAFEPAELYQQFAAEAPLQLYSERAGQPQQQQQQLEQSAREHFVQLLQQQQSGQESQETGCPAASHQRQLNMPGSSSFASAADLLARHQQQQQQRQSPAGEPIYQRLDRFKACALPACRQFATLNPQFAAKFKQDYMRQQQQQQQPFHYSIDDQFVHAGQATSDGGAFFLPPPPPPAVEAALEPIYQQQQQAAPGDQQQQLQQLQHLVPGGVQAALLHEAGEPCNQSGCA